MSNPSIVSKTDTQRKVRRRTVMAFSVFFVCIGCGVFLFCLLYNQQQKDSVQPLLRAGLNLNEKIFRTFFSAGHEAKAFSASDAEKKVRVNGGYGMDGRLDSATWRMKVALYPGDTLAISLADLMKLPKTEVIFDFKCIEGWSQVTRWAGVRFSDFVEHYHLQAQASKNYAGMITPDGEYYIGVDMPGMLHPQTILCYEMNGQLLPQNQGYPLRLIIPVKYGIKHIKRIGVMYFSDNRPPDYWAERGYDYYSGL